MAPIAVFLAGLLVAGPVIDPRRQDTDPWAKYAPTTLASRHAVDAVEIEAFGDSDRGYTGNAFPSRALVRFTGRSRPLSPRCRKLAVEAVTMFGFATEAEAIIQDEWEFEELGRSFWLPVQSQVAGFFCDELEAGDQLWIYFVLLGGVREAGEMHVLFLVNEFQRAD